MYDKALFSDATYAAIVQALENIVATNFMQLIQLEIWRCMFNFSAAWWIN